MSHPVKISSVNAAPGGESYISEEILARLGRADFLKLLPNGDIKIAFQVTRRMLCHYGGVLPLFNRGFSNGVFSDGSAEEIPLARVSAKALEFVGFTPETAATIWAEYSKQQSVRDSASSPHPYSPMSLLHHIVGHLHLLQGMFDAGISQELALQSVGLPPAFLNDLRTYYGDGAGFRSNVVYELVMKSITGKYTQLIRWHCTVRRIGQERISKVKKQLPVSVSCPLHSYVPLNLGGGAPANVPVPVDVPVKVPDPIPVKVPPKVSISRSTTSGVSSTVKSSSVFKPLLVN
ncbi:hypothetical protein N7539_004024 [Penicillium diatomitis]|uniref:Uncharacterized protein n=1 Tax=Penicillium diatomitis TaxID=2819901 RepID=A0A9X0BY43_9EURO|nr:uncharacterized protein N7539_004024 [Penicillium diatomitis]KAJ5489134.1 hypothetical protein N7539_004024 [Penicillium diatomitis]